jgi:hypothetical protein
MAGVGRKLRAFVLSALLVSSVVAVGGLGSATNATTTTVTDPGNDAPYPGETTTALNLTVTSQDTVISAGSGDGTAEAGDPTAAFDAGTATSPEMYVDDGTTTGYQDEDDIVLIERERNGTSAVGAGSDGLNEETLQTFSSDVEFLDSAGDGYDDDEAIIRQPGLTSFYLDANDDILTNGTGGTGVTAFGSEIIWYDTDDGATSGVGGYDGDSGYEPSLTSAYRGEPIYDEGPTAGLGNDGSETRFTFTLVVSGTDSNVATIDAGLNRFTDLGSSEADTSKSLSTTTGGWLLVETESGGTTGSWDVGDTSETDGLVWDADGSGDVSRDDVLIFEEDSSLSGKTPGDKLDGGESFAAVTDISGSAQLGFDGSGTDDTTYQSGDVVFLDPEGNGAAGDDVALDSAGAPEILAETGTEAFTPGGTVKIWDAALSSGYNSQDGVFVEITDSDGQTAPGDVRLSSWTAELSAGTTVESNDADALVVGGDTQSDWGADRFVDATNPGSDALDAPLDEAIVDTAGTNPGRLERDDTVVTAGNAGGTEFTSPPSADGTTGVYYVDQGSDGSGSDASSADTAGYDDGDDILTVHTESVGSNAASLDGATLLDFPNDVGYVDGVTAGTNAAGVSSDDAYNGDGSANADVEAVVTEADRSTPAFGEAEDVQFGDAVDALTVSNDGSLPNGGIDSVALYRDGSQVTTTSTPRGDGSWVLDAPAGTADVGPGGTTFQVRATLASGASAGKTLNLSVDAVSDDGNDTFDTGESGLFFEQNAPTDDLANGAAITVDARPDDGGGGGGPPSSSTTTSDGELRVSVTNADAGEPLEIDLPESAAMRDTGVTMERLRVTLTRSGDARLTIDTMNSPGYAPPDDTESLFAYRVSDNLQPADLERATVRLRVDRDRVDDPDAVRVLRWTDPGWEGVDTSLTDRSDGELVYEVNTTDFSLFAVVESETAATTPTATATPMPEEPRTPTGTASPDSDETATPTPTATPVGTTEGSDPATATATRTAVGSTTTGSGPGLGVGIAAVAWLCVAVLSRRFG